MISYALVFSGIAIAGLVGVASVQSFKIAKLDAVNIVTQTELSACGARLANLIEDLESDNAIDTLPDGALTSVPAHWLRPLSTD